MNTSLKKNAVTNSGGDSVMEIRTLNKKEYTELLKERGCTDKEIEEILERCYKNEHKNQATKIPK